jgi:hypothetical protein
LVAVCGRGAAHNTSHYNLVFVNVEIVDDAVIAYAAAPRTGLSFEAFDVAAEGILLKGSSCIASRAFLTPARSLGGSF